MSVEENSKKECLQRRAVSDKRKKRKDGEVTERDFWTILTGRLNAEQDSPLFQGIYGGDLRTEGVEEYIKSHSLLPTGYDGIPLETLKRMSDLLFNEQVSLKTKKTILLLLAHQKDQVFYPVLERYVRAPDKELVGFSTLALQEYKMWNG